MSYEPLAAEIAAMRAGNARMKKALCEIADAARSPLVALDPLAMLKTIAEEALLAVREAGQ
jgi:hypothetical protein